MAALFAPIDLATERASQPRRRMSAFGGGFNWSTQQEHVLSRGRCWLGADCRLPQRQSRGGAVSAAAQLTNASPQSRIIPLPRWIGDRPSQSLVPSTASRRCREVPPGLPIACSPRSRRTFLLPRSLALCGFWLAPRSTHRARRPPQHLACANKLLADDNNAQRSRVFYRRPTASTISG